MKAEIFAYWFRLIVKILIPVSFFVIASWPGASYWLAGVMLILTLFYYLLVYNHLGDKVNS